MTDEIKVETPAQEESKTEETTVETKAQSNPAEERAASLGWVPKEEWEAQGKDPEDWKPAKLFLEHGEMIGQIRSKAKELEDTRRAINFMHEKNKQAYEKGYQTALSELRAKKRAALAEGDLVAADEIDEKIDATKDALRTVQQAPPPQVAPQVDPDHLEWVARNPWYNDEVMVNYADAIAIAFVNKAKKEGLSITPNMVRKHVEEKVKEDFPHKFPSKTKGPPNPDGEGRVARKTSTNGLDPKLAQAESGMSDEEKQIMRTMIKATGMTKEKYLKQYVS